MTREEAVKELQLASREVVDHWYLKDPIIKKEAEIRIEALNIGIEALKQEPCEDAISREEALKRIDEYIDEYAETDIEGFHSEKWCAMQEARMVLEKLPSTQPSRPHGEWIETEFGLKCSHCNLHTFMGRTERPIISDFCPNCGADIRPNGRAKNENNR